MSHTTASLGEPAMPELSKWQIIIGFVLGLTIPGATFAAAWTPA